MTDLHLLAYGAGDPYIRQEATYNLKRQYHWDDQRISQEVINYRQQYDWHGNKKEG